MLPKPLSLALLIRLFEMSKLNHEHEQNRAPLLTGYAETYIKLSKDRIIFLAEDVSKETAAELSALLLYYDNEDHEAPITLYIHTNGGDASGLSNIYDVMQMVQAPIKTVCLGKCYSAGSIILAAGMPGERYIMKNAKVMLHGIQCGFPIPGHDMVNSKNYYEFLEDNNDNIMKLLARHTGHSLEKIKADTLRDLWLDSKQAVEYGVVDHII